MAITGTGTGVITITSSTDAIPSSTVMVISSLRWAGATTAGHSCEVTDAAGNVIFYSVANAANFVDGWVFDQKWIAGLEITTMDSGELQIYQSAR